MRDLRRQKLSILLMITTVISFDGQTDRQIDKQKERQKDIQAERKTKRHTEIRDRDIEKVRD